MLWLRSGGLNFLFFDAEIDKKQNLIPNPLPALTLFHEEPRNLIRRKSCSIKQRHHNFNHFQAQSVEDINVKPDAFKFSFYTFFAQRRENVQHFEFAEYQISCEVRTATPAYKFFRCSAVTTMNAPMNRSLSRLKPAESLLTTVIFLHSIVNKIQ